jgi:hypothetical protein
LKPRRTLSSVIARLEEIGRERQREAVEKLSPIRRFACEKHAWSPSGPGSTNWWAIGSLCPSCQGDRKRREREAEAPEVHTLDLWNGGPLASKLWQAQRDRLKRQDHVLAGSAAEREIVRTIDDLRADALYDLRQTAADRRRLLAEHWQRRLRRGRKPPQRYERHPARAGR